MRLTNLASTSFISLQLFGRRGRISVEFYVWESVELLWFLWFGIQSFLLAIFFLFLMFLCTELVGKAICCFGLLRAALFAGYGILYLILCGFFAGEFLFSATPFGRTGKGCTNSCIDGLKKKGQTYISVPIARCIICDAEQEERRNKKEDFEHNLCAHIDNSERHAFEQ